MNYFLLGACLVIALAGCEQDTVVPATTTPTVSFSGSGNAITFAASDWEFFLGNTGAMGNPNQYQSSRTTDGSTTTSSFTAISPLTTITTKAESYSLGISAITIKDTVSYSYWTTAMAPPKTLVPGKSLTLRTKVQLQDVKGKGVSLVLRGDRKTQSDVLFATTYGKTFITGTGDFTEYSVTLPYTTSVDYILLYLVVLPQTTGKVIFKDVSVQVN